MTAYQVDSLVKAKAGQPEGNFITDLARMQVAKGIADDLFPIALTTVQEVWGVVDEWIVNANVFMLDPKDQHPRDIWIVIRVPWTQERADTYGQVTQLVLSRVLKALSVMGGRLSKGSKEVCVDIHLQHSSHRYGVVEVE